MELPADVKVLIQSGNKIEAIRQLRLNQNMDLKQAKDLVDEYSRQQPESEREADSTGMGSWLLAFAIIGLMVYWFLNKG